MLDLWFDVAQRGEEHKEVRVSLGYSGLAIELLTMAECRAMASYLRSVAETLEKRQDEMRSEFEKWLTRGKPHSAATERKALYAGLCGWDEYRSTHVAAMWKAWKASRETASGSFAEDEANARLMAASKDLLEALQGMMEFAWIIEERLGTAETDKARAAIAKALGLPR